MRLMKTTGRCALHRPRSNITKMSRQFNIAWYQYIWPVYQRDWMRFLPSHEASGAYMNSIFNHESNKLIINLHATISSYVQINPNVHTPRGISQSKLIPITSWASNVITSCLLFNETVGTQWPTGHHLVMSTYTHWPELLREFRMLITWDISELEDNSMTLKTVNCQVLVSKWFWFNFHNS